MHIHAFIYLVHDCMTFTLSVCFLSELITYYLYFLFSLHLMMIFICVSLQRAAQQLKAQRQLEETLESHLQRVQNNMQANSQTGTLVSSDTSLSETNLSSGTDKLFWALFF